MEVDKNKVENIQITYKVFDKDSFMGVTEWPNGEGYDITIQNDLGTHIFQLHFTDVDALNFCISSLNLKLVE